MRSAEVHTCYIFGAVVPRASLVILRRVEDMLDQGFDVSHSFRVDPYAMAVWPAYFY